MIFLKEVTKNIVDRWNDLGDFCIVCPNKRTQDYLKFYMSSLIKKTIWSPKFINISDIVASKSNILKADDLVLLVELYKSFKKIMSSSKHFAKLDFEKFSGIGEIILKDFNEIDNYLLDVSDIFKNMSDIENINYIDDYLSEDQKIAIKEFFGHFSEKDLSEEKEYFLELWSKIPDLYQLYKENLQKKNIGYNGMIIKQVVNDIKADKISFDEFDNYLIVGFYALTKAQKFVLSEIKKVKNVEFFWDYDNYYKNNINNEAGLFIRHNLNEFTDDLKVDRDNFLKEKNVSLIGFPLEISQTKALPTILKKMNIDLADKNSLSRTAIVLPDEKLLFPVLYSLPSEIEQVNVTIGFPFRNSAVFSFIEKWFNILLKLIVNEKVFSDDVFKFYENQIVTELLSESYEYVLKKSADLKLMYFSIEHFSKLNNRIIDVLFSAKNINTVDDLLNNILLTLELIFKRISKNNRTVETEAIYQFYTQMLNVQSLFSKELAEEKDIITVKTILKFLKQLLSGVHIPFTGKSLNGMQLMTIMETRNIDFDNLIVLNLNEQIIPKKASHSSLISEFMRKSFGLPVFAYQDSIFAYLFYRLLQNSKNITLTYSNLISDKSGEMSRFIQQILNETNLISEHLQYSEEIRPQHATVFEIKKDKIVSDKLERYLNSDKALSASGFNTYISCPVKFYFKYIAEIKPEETNDIDYEIDAIKFGNIFHNSIEELYYPYINKELKKQNFDAIKSNIDEVVQKQIFAELENIEDAAEAGINNIIADVVKKHIINVLNYDESNLPFTIKSLETSTKYYGNIDFTLKEEEKRVKIFSIFDRVDQKNDNFKIIDYKTGSDELKVKSIEKLFDESGGYKTKAIFQMLLYSLVYRQNFPGRKFEPNLFLVKNINKEFSGSLWIDKHKIDSYSVSLFDVFEQNLKLLLAEIFDTDKTFKQTKNPDNCKYCDYKGICGV